MSVYPLLSTGYILHNRHVVYVVRLLLLSRVRPNVVFVAENGNLCWFRSLSFTAKNDVAFLFSVSFSV